MPTRAAVRRIIPVEVKKPFFRSWFSPSNVVQGTEFRSSCSRSKHHFIHWVKCCWPYFKNKLCITQGLKIGHALHSWSFGFRLSSSVCSQRAQWLSRWVASVDFLALSSSVPILFPCFSPSELLEEKRCRSAESAAGTWQTNKWPETGCWKDVGRAAGNGQPA